MEKKEPIKVSLPIYIAIVVILVAVVFSIYMNIQNKKLEKEIANLREEITQSQATKNELQEKLNNISNIVKESEKADTNENETKDKEKSNMVSFTDEQVKESLSNYFDLKITIGDGILKKLTQKGLLNYNASENKETKRGGDLENIVTMKVKFSDYKKAMLNYVSESEFNKTFKNYFEVDNNEYLSYETGIGGPDIYSTVKSVTKKDEVSYTAKMEFVTQDSLEPAENENYTFTIKNNNGKCVIDSINKK